MKARKRDGTRWFTPTTIELVDRWLCEPQLLYWLACTAASNELEQLVQSLEQTDAALEQVEQALIEALLHELAAKKASAAALTGRIATYRQIFIAWEKARDAAGGGELTQEQEAEWAERANDVWLEMTWPERDESHRGRS